MCIAMIPIVSSSALLWGQPHAIRKTRTNVANAIMIKARIPNVPILICLKRNNMRIKPLQRISLSEMVQSSQFSKLPGYIAAIFSVRLLSKKYLTAYVLSLQRVSKWEQCYQREKFDMTSNLQSVRFYLVLSNSINRQY